MSLSAHQSRNYLSTSNLPEDLLALSLLPWYPPQRRCFSLILSSNVFLGTGTVSDNANLMSGALTYWSHCCAESCIQIIMGFKRDRGGRETSDRDANEKEDTGAVWKVGWAETFCRLRFLMTKPLVTNMNVYKRLIKCTRTPLRLIMPWNGSPKKKRQKT